MDSEAQAEGRRRTGRSHTFNSIYWILNEIPNSVLAIIPIPFNSIYWIRLLVLLLQSPLETSLCFQFHLLDSRTASSCTRLCKDKLAFNSIYWIRTKDDVCNSIIYGLTFNSIYWILFAYLFSNGIAIPSFFQFHLLDSGTYGWALPLRRWLLSIPFIGFTRRWGRRGWDEETSFQFHLLDSTHQQLRGCDNSCWNAFNSIYWILLGETNVNIVLHKIYFQFHLLDSIICNYVFNAHHSWHLSIPFIGFPASPSPSPGRQPAYHHFQFHLLDSNVALTPASILADAFNSIYWIPGDLESPVGQQMQSHLPFNSIYWILATLPTPQWQRLRILSIPFIGFSGQHPEHSWQSS